jgi:dihydrofolate synthase/folylpolyglutamate synthase
VETAVIEVGLGGRLDATNVLTPLASVVTNVALDHTHELGDSLLGVAAEKAGIFKAGVPAISGETDTAVQAVLRARAAAVGAPFHSLDEAVTIEQLEIDLEGTSVTLDSRHWGRHALRTPLIGAHQGRNAALAAEALALLPAGIRPDWDEVARGFATVRWPGRFQVERIRGTTWIFDVAHNPAGVGALARAIVELRPPRPIVVVVGILSDKRWEEMLPPLLHCADASILTIPASAPPSRRWDPTVVADHARHEHGIQPRIIPDLPAALSRAATLAPHGTVLVTGSIHTVGDALAALDLL